MSDGDSSLAGPPAAHSVPGETAGHAADSDFFCRLPIEPKNAAVDFVKIVLALADLLRETMERQAILRMERGTLTDTQIDDLSTAFEAIDQKLDELCEAQGIARADLEIDLGDVVGLGGLTGESET